MSHRSWCGENGGMPSNERLEFLGDAILQWVVTDLGILTPDPSTCELVMSSMHPGVTRDQCVDATGWHLQFADDVAVTEPPTARELDAVRALQSA